MRYYVYILTNKYNKVLYIGVTNDLMRRIAEHKSGVNDGFTKRYNCDKLIYAEIFNNPEDAIRREKFLKNFNRQKKIELINSVNPDWTEIEPF